MRFKQCKEEITEGQASRDKVPYANNLFQFSDTV